jgi:hypothetical protein
MRNAMEKRSGAWVIVLVLGLGLQLQFASLNSEQHRTDDPQQYQ